MRTWLSLLILLPFLSCSIPERSKERSQFTADSLIADSLSGAASKAWSAFHFSDQTDSTLLQKAVEDYDRAFELDSSRYNARISSARFLYQLGDTEEAIRRVEQVLNQSVGYSGYFDHATYVDYAQVMLTVGIWRETGGQQEQAQQWYNRAVDAFERRRGNKEYWDLNDEMEYALALYLAGKEAEAYEVANSEECPVILCDAIKALMDDREKVLNF